MALMVIAMVRLTVSGLTPMRFSGFIADSIAVMSSAVAVVNVKSVATSIAAVRRSAFAVTDCH